MEKKIQIGLGLRKEIANEFLTGENIQPDFVELAPENWIDMGGRWKQVLDKISDKYKIFSHGLSLSIGSTEPLDLGFLKKVKEFLKTYHIGIYSEHLSFAKTHNAHLYDLMPLSFREENIIHVSKRIQQVQDILKRPLILENVSYYTPVAAEMEEIEFINEIVNQSGCNLLLDVNNVYVNSFNHHYDAYEFIDNLPLERVKYIHMAGHKKIDETLIIDTHGEPIIKDVFQLFDYTTSKIKKVPVLLERDFNFPEAKLLQKEMNEIRNICKKHWL